MKKKNEFITSDVINPEDWKRRFYNPSVKMAWNSAIEVIPGSFENHTPGTRIYPDGTQETFIP
jgi:hypothetical protein